MSHDGEEPVSVEAFIAEQLDAAVRARLREAGCQCSACWCCVCGADLARFPERPGEHHVCPPSPVEPMGILEFLALTDDA